MDELTKYLQSIALDDVTDLNNASGGHSLVNGGGSGKTGGENKGVKDLEAHDRRFHPHGFDPSKDKCSLRENMGVKGGEEKQSSNAVEKVDTGVKGVGEVEPQNIAERKAAVELAKMAKGGNQNAANALKQANEANKREQFAKEYGEENADYEMEKQRKVDIQYDKDKEARIEARKNAEKEANERHEYYNPYKIGGGANGTLEDYVVKGSRNPIESTGEYKPPENLQAPTNGEHTAIGVGRSGKSGNGGGDGRFGEHQYIGQGSGKTSAYGVGYRVGLGTKSGSPYDYSESDESGWGKSWKTDSKTGDRVRTDGKFGTLIGPDGRPAGSVRPTFKYDPTESETQTGNPYGYIGSRKRRLGDPLDTDFDADFVKRWYESQTQTGKPWDADIGKKWYESDTQRNNRRYLDKAKVGTKLVLPYGRTATKNEDGSWTIITSRKREVYNAPRDEYDDGGTSIETQRFKKVVSSRELARYNLERYVPKVYKKKEKEPFPDLRLGNNGGGYIPEWWSK